MQDRQFATGRSASFCRSPARESAGLSSPGWPCSPLSARAAESEFTIEARDFDGGNARVSLTGQPYADGPSCIWNAGELPNWAEYEIEFPVTADYTLSALYAAAQARPVEISLDEKLVHTGLSRRDGQLEHHVGQVGRAMHAAHHPRHAHHHASVRGSVSAHLRLASGVVRAVSRRLATAAAHRRATGRAVRTNAPASSDQRPRSRRWKPSTRKLCGWPSKTWSSEFPGRYDGGTAPKDSGTVRSGERAALLKSLADGQEVSPESVEELLAGVRAALLANPLLDFDKLLVVRRNFGGARARQVASVDAGFVAHNYQNHTSMPRGGWDNEIAVLSNLRGQPQIDRLYKPSGGQILRDVRLDFSGRSHAVLEYRCQRPLGHLRNPQRRQRPEAVDSRRLSRSGLLRRLLLARRPDRALFDGQLLSGCLA